MTNKAVLSIDFELFTQTPAYRNAEGTVEESGVGLDGGTFLRKLLAANDIQTTCFVVGEVAKQFPNAVRAFAEDGHEIGSHTYTHRLLTELDAETRRHELVKSRDCLQKVTGRDIAGFRAPAFAFGGDHFTALSTAGYDYDASVNPSRRIPGWYGGNYDMDRPVPATTVQADAPPGLMELPTSVMPGLRLPLTGTWLRFFGPYYTILGMRLLAQRGITPVLYVHPWEFVDLPAVDGVPSRVYYHTGAWMREAVTKLLAQPFEFVTAAEMLTPARQSTMEQQ